MQPQRPLDLGAVVSQIADKTQVPEMLCYGGFDSIRKGFHPDHQMEVESWQETLIGCEKPGPSDLVVCVDYLHTISLLRITDVLDDLKRVTTGVGFFQVRTDLEIEFKQVDKPVIWWLTEFSKRFDLQTYQRIPGGFYVIVYPKAN